MTSAFIKDKSTKSFIWLMCYFAIIPVSITLSTPSLPRIYAYYLLNARDGQWIFSLFLVGCLVGQLFYGPIANQYGRLEALRIGLIINLLGLILSIIAVLEHTYVLFIIGRVITGFGVASGHSCTFMLVNEWLPETRRKAASAYSVVAMALGIGLSTIVGGVVAQYWNWLGGFWILLIYGIIMLYGVRVFDETLATPQSFQLRNIFRNDINAFLSIKLTVFSMIAGFCTAIAQCFSVAGPNIAETALLLSSAKYGYWNTLNIVGMLCGGLLSNIVLTSLSINKTIRIGFVGIAIGIISLLIFWLMNSKSILWFFMSTTDLFLFSGLLFSSGSFVASNALDNKATSAVMMSFINLGFAAISLILMSYLGHQALLRFILILSIIWFFIVGIFYLVTNMLYFKDIHSQ